MTSEDLQSYFEFRKALFSGNEPVRYILCGSFFEMPLLYFVANPTDIDIMCIDMTLCAIYSHGSVPSRCTRNVLIIDATDCHVGFARLRNGAEYFRKPFGFDRGPARMKTLNILATVVGAFLRKIFKKWRDVSVITEDNVYALSCPHWPPDANEWITRKRLNGWPAENVVKEIVKAGCHLVSKPHASKPNDDTQWRYSFSQAEAVLIRSSWTDVQKYIYHLLKVIKKDLIRQCGGESQTFISNYYFKTVMFWACEQKPPVFWDDRNSVKAVRELIIDFIARLVERNFPNYFIPANNMMDHLPRNANIDNEISLLLSCREEEILNIMRREPKVYQMNPSFVVISNQIVYPMVVKLLYFSININTRGRLRKSMINCICSSNYMFPELEHLHKGIMMHVQLLKFDRYEKTDSRQNAIASADAFFDQSLNKRDCGFTRIHLKAGWSIFEVFKQRWFSHDDKLSENLMPCSGARDQMTTSTCCYIRDRNEYIRNQCSYLSNRKKTIDFTIIQKFMLSEIAMPINATYFVCSTYRANFYFNAICNYTKTLSLCKEIITILESSSNVDIDILFCDLLPFPLRNEWSGLYDMYIQIILGFLTLYRTITDSPKVRKGTIPVYICSVRYLKYVYTRCCRILNKLVTDFGYDHERLCQKDIDILRYRGHFSNAILRTALYISTPNHLRLSSMGTKNLGQYE